MRFLLLLFSSMSHVKANRHYIYGKGSDRQLMNIKVQLLHIMRLTTFGMALCMCQPLLAKYNPQNEAFRLFRTNRIIS